MQLTPTELFILGSAWGALWGIVGWWANHLLSKSRDRDARRLDFREFLGRWRSEIQLTVGGSVHGAYAAYISRIHDFHAFQTKLQNDFFCRWRFTRLCRELDGIPGDCASKDCRALITQRIDALIAFL
jgi:hypothetical protein